MASQKQKRALEISLENGGNMSKAMREAGYSPATAKNPDKLTKSGGFLKLMEEALPDNSLVDKHKKLLNTTKIEHMVFPREGIDPDDMNLVGQENAKQITDILTDQDIIDMLAEVNCKVKRIMHGETARHVWYWVGDATAQQKALELAYKLKGYTGNSGEGGSTTFIGVSVNQKNEYGI